MELTDSVKNLLIETAKQLKGAAKRRFMFHVSCLSGSISIWHLILLGGRKSL